jgi:hypothetical protein
MDIITALSVIEGLGVVADRAGMTSLIGLLEDRPGCVLRGIHFKGVGMIRVRLLEDGVTQNDLFELLNGSCAVGSPGKGDILLGKFGQGLGNIGETPDEWALVAEYA